MWKKKFDDADGKLLLEDLKERCWVYKPTPLGEAGQRAEGNREVLLHIESNINYEEPKQGVNKDE